MIDNNDVIQYAKEFNRVGREVWENIEDWAYDRDYKMITDALMRLTIAKEKLSHAVNHMIIEGGG